MEWYMTIKAWHIISVVAWFAGLFYLPRLFVYHVEMGNKHSHEMLVTMERKLFKYIMTPAMISTWFFGGLMLYLVPELLSDGWIHAKLTLVFILSGYQGALGKYRKQLRDGECTKSGKFFRLVNEFPTLVLIAVVLLAVLKPF